MGTETLGISSKKKQVSEEKYLPDNSDGWTLSSCDSKAILSEFRKASKNLADVDKIKPAWNKALRTHCALYSDSTNAMPADAYCEPVSLKKCVFGSGGEACFGDNQNVTSCAKKRRTWQISSLPNIAKNSAGIGFPILYMNAVKAKARFQRACCSTFVEPNDSKKLVEEWKAIEESPYQVINYGILDRSDSSDYTPDWPCLSSVTNTYTQFFDPKTGKYDCNNVENMRKAVESGLTLKNYDDEQLFLGNRKLNDSCLDPDLPQQRLKNYQERPDLCKPGLACAYAADQNADPRAVPRCVPEAGDGEKCLTSISQCKDGLTCIQKGEDRTKWRCAPYRKLGETCDSLHSCDLWSECNEKSGRCESNPSLSKATKREIIEDFCDARRLYPEKPLFLTNDN